MRNSELAHDWAHQKREKGRGSNLFYEGTKIYSYGYHFLAANIINDIYFISSDNYSPSTHRHISYIRQAIPHDSIVIHVPEVPTCLDGVVNALGHLLNEIERDIEVLTPKLKRARVINPLYSAETKLRYANLILTHFNFIHDTAPKEVERVANVENFFLSGEYLKCEEKLNKEKQRQAELAQKKAENDLIKFLKHEKGFVRSPYQMIRAVGPRVQTSLGLSFNPEPCQKLINAWKDNFDLVGMVFMGFTITHADDKQIIIGCHKFRKSDLPIFEAEINKALDCKREAKGE